MSRLSPLALTGALIATGLSVLGASPAPARAPQSVVVSYRDLDLSSDAGRRTLDRRLRDAASSVCPVVARELATTSACRFDAYARAHDDLRLAQQGGAARLAR